ncbi:DUF4265 domain-containing protein [Allokutzneria sp. A3M-2-11 16]|uniref:DUF4265 domain-containing protein n=1 Tax=Allokutzneria sp. A3M-2-11 16 TaxID=2962043 RepID=UPI0020B66C81|nr:DUF4265 domain-containing protein [Allokutzneria sp. A3M-2-11 16]MCP3805474.1 DUF4265 domain-containing protein [Allokutzneria sp. A3M-2-11 16]
MAFDLPADTAAWAPAPTERLWARKTAVTMEVEICNVPFYVKAISLSDRVRVVADHDRRELVFESLVSESGHSTVRIIIMSGDAAEVVESTLTASGCSWEIDSSGILWAVDVPPSVDYRGLRSALVDLKENGKIDLEEGAVSASHRMGGD